MGPSFRVSSFFFACLTVSTFAGSAFAEDPAPEPAPAPASPEAGVFVHLRADDPRATLERRSKVETYSGLPIKDAAIVGVATWTPECVAPCEASIDPKYAYRVGGDGLVPSSTFILPRGGDVTVDAKMGSAYGRLGGLALVGTGAGGMVLGVAALAVTPILANDNVGTPAVRSGVMVSGAALTGLGALALGAGLWLWAQNDTKVHPDPMRGIVF
jgi:hypothetical protein